MSMFWALFVVVLLTVQGCAVERDPRGEWGHFQNRIPNAQFDGQVRPWGEKL